MKPKTSRGSYLLSRTTYFSRCGRRVKVPWMQQHYVEACFTRGEFAAAQGATNLAEYKKYIEKDGIRQRRFQPVKVGGANSSRNHGILLK